MSYLFDVYAEKAPVQKNLCKLALYISLFPQLIAGPIVRYTDVMTAIDSRSVDYADVKTGIRRFSVGLAKKVLISNSVGLYADMAFSAPVDQLSISAAWLGVLCYTLQIYFDFSGYSDMAIGIGRMIGFRFPENFDRPYTSYSIQDFWRRWHISLSTWFRDYLYIPLGGNRKGVFRTICNQLIVFALCGIWHGAEWTFLIWGLYHGLFLGLERIPAVKTLFGKLPAAIRRIYTMLVVMIGWVFFRAESLTHATSFLKSMVGMGSGQGLMGDQVSLSLTAAACIAEIVFAMGKVPICYEETCAENLPGKWIILQEVLIILSLVLSLIRVVPNNYNPFIYFRF